MRVTVEPAGFLVHAFAVSLLCICSATACAASKTVLHPILKSDKYQSHESEFAARKLVELWLNGASFESTRALFCSQAQASTGRPSKLTILVDKLARKYVKAMFEPNHESRVLISAITVGAGYSIAPDRAAVLLYFDLSDSGAMLQDQAEDSGWESDTKSIQWEFSTLR